VRLKAGGPIRADSTERVDTRGWLGLQLANLTFDFRKNTNDELCRRIGCACASAENCDDRG